MAVESVAGCRRNTHLEHTYHTHLYGTSSPEPHHERFVRAFHDGAGREVAIVIPDTLRGLLRFRFPGHRGRVVII